MKRRVWEEEGSEADAITLISNQFFMEFHHK